MSSRWRGLVSVNKPPLQACGAGGVLCCPSRYLAYGWRGVGSGKASDGLGCSKLRDGYQSRVESSDVGGRR